MAQQHMTQVATVVAGTDCLTLVMLLSLSFFSSPYAVLRLPPLAQEGQVVTRGTPPHVEGCRSVGRGHATDTQDLAVHSMDKCMTCQSIGVQCRCARSHGADVCAPGAARAARGVSVSM